MPLKYLSNFWRSLEIPLIYCKEWLKLEWTKYRVLSANGNDSVNDNVNDNNDNNIIFTIKDKKIYVPVVTVSARDNQTLPKLFSKGFEICIYWRNIKQKVTVKILTYSLTGRISSEISFSCWCQSWRLQHLLTIGKWI